MNILHSGSTRACVLILTLALLLASCDRRSWHRESYAVRSVTYPDGQASDAGPLSRTNIFGQDATLRILPSVFVRDSDSPGDNQVGPYKVWFEFKDSVDVDKLSNSEDIDKLIIIRDLDIRSNRGIRYEFTGPDSFPFEVPSTRNCYNPPDIGAHKGRKSYCLRLHRYVFEPDFDFDFHGGELLNVELEVEVHEKGNVVRQRVHLTYEPVLDADSEWFFNPPSA